MRRKQITILTLIAVGTGYLWFSGEIYVRSWREGAMKSTSIISTSSGEQLTWKLLISPWWSHKNLLAELQQAKYTIDIRWYQITDKDLINMLINKAKTGVKIRIILENSMHGNEAKDYLSFYKQTKWSGIEVHTDEWLWTNYVHAKTFIVDTNTFIVSTANSTYPWFFGNREYWFIGKQKSYAWILEQVFERDWQKQPWTEPLPESLRICPFNCRSSVIAFIKKATKSIDIQAQYLEDKELIQLLEDKIKQWVTLRLIFGKYQEDSLPKELKQLTRLQADPNVHAKNILIDNQALYIWSMNLSANALDNNREIGVVSSDRFVIQSFMKQFQDDRESKAIPYK